MLCHHNHDTTDGIEEGISAGKSWNVDVVPGIELNTQLDLNEIHILGYYIEWHFAIYRISCMR